MKKLVLTIILLVTVFTEDILSQDTNFIFKSPRPLLESSIALRDYNHIAGADIFITEAGFGLGGHYQKYINKKFLFQCDINFSGLKNSDEQKAQYITPEGDIVYLVLNKVNRIYRMPLSIGVKYNVLSSILGDGFKPYIGAGVGGSMIFILPYEEFHDDFFGSINYMKTEIKPLAYVETGADFGSDSKKRSTVYVRYYYIPYGGKGIESIRDLPIENCGGVFLGLRFGFAW